MSPKELDKRDIQSWLKLELASEQSQLYLVFPTFYPFVYIALAIATLTKSFVLFTIARCIFGGDPENGFAVRNAFFKRMVKHGLQIVYRCNEHYALIGSATQECNNGQWTNARPSCKGKCRWGEKPRNLVSNSELIRIKSSPQEDLLKMQPKMSSSAA